MRASAQSQAERIPKEHSMQALLQRRQALALGLSAASGSVLAQSAKPRAAADSATGWPSRPVRLLVGFPGGSTPDLVARTLAEPLSRALGQPVVVENKTGAGGNIAADQIAKATDGHTLGVLINGNMTIAKLLNPSTPFDPLKDLAPVSLVGTAPLLLTVPANAPGHTALEWFVAARNAGSTWSYGTPGVGTVGHIGMELLKSRTNISPVHVPYPGNPQVINAMIGGQVQLSLLPPGLAGPQSAGTGVPQPGRDRCHPRLPAGDLDRRGRAGQHAQAGDCQGVGTGRRHRAQPRGAGQAVPAGLAGGGHLQRGPGQPHQDRYRPAGRRDPDARHQGRVRRRSAGAALPGRLDGARMLSRPAAA